MRRQSSAPLILPVMLAAMISGCAASPLRSSDLQGSPNMDNSSSATLTGARTKAGQVIAGVLNLLKNKRSIQEFNIAAVSDSLGNQASTVSKDHFGYRESLSPDWSYVLDVRRNGEKGARLDVNFINKSAGEMAPATEVCEFDFERVAAELKQAGYQQDTNYGEHGRIVYEQFHRAPITVTISTTGEASTPPDKVTHRCIQILTAQ